VILPISSLILDACALVQQLCAKAGTAMTSVVFVTGLDAPALGPPPARSTVLRKPCHQGKILATLLGVLPA